jgi:dipeptidyl aminopeptidase/acylaminoacyl peptidase
VAQGHADRDKVAIMGGSYGGYATLVGLTYTPEVFACGVDIVGPSNLETLLETIPPYWAPMVKQFHDRMGDPTTPDGLQLLKDCSPIHKADQIVKPLLIGQGANDPRVKQSESDQIVAAMQGHGIPVTYVLFPDEGHGFHRPENNIAFNAVVEGFLATVLGGRAEPLGAALAASTAQILTGEDMVQGLG